MSPWITFWLLISLTKLIPCFSRTVPYNRLWKMSKCGKNIWFSDMLGWASCATFLFLPHFDVICDFTTEQMLETWNPFVDCTIHSVKIYYLIIAIKRYLSIFHEELLSRYVSILSKIYQITHNQHILCLFTSENYLETRQCGHS